MYCLRCGREIPDGELFCRTCGKQPIEKQQPPEIREPVRVQEAARATVAERQETVAVVPKKKMNKLLIPMLLTLMLAIAACVFTLYTYQQINIQKANYRVKEANLTLRENELSDLEKNYELTCAELEAANRTIDEQNAEIRGLNQEILEWESAASQNEYDAATAQKAIEELTTANEELTGANEELTTANEELTEVNKGLEAENTALDQQILEKTAEVTAIRAELDYMTASYETASTKANFMDSYVVFVNNNGTKYYHNYDCYLFSKSNFWAYSRKLAQNQGYSACPSCGG